MKAVKVKVCTGNFNWIHYVDSVDQAVWAAIKMKVATPVVEVVDGIRNAMEDYIYALPIMAEHR